MQKAAKCINKFWHPYLQYDYVKSSWPKVLLIAKLLTLGQDKKLICCINWVLNK
jgi:hypothetical protein